MNARRKFLLSLTIATASGGKIYGVVGEPSSNSLLTRVNDSVGLSYQLNSDGTINSDFDNAEIYSEIQDVNINGNVFVRVPKHYTQYIYDSDSGLLATRISKVKHDDSWKLNPCFMDDNGNELDYVDVGKYSATFDGTKLTSVSGQSPKVSITISQFREYAKLNGSGYGIIDIWTIKMLQDLFKIEFTNISSRSIMYGYANDNSASIASGRTDSVATASGSEVSNTDGNHAMKYRGVENLWGNVWQWVDGINFQDGNIYVCEKQGSYASDVFSGDYHSVGYQRLTSSGIYISKLGYDENNPFIQYPTTAGGSGSTYYGDYYWYNSDNRVLRLGGYWGNGLYAGFWCCFGSNASSAANSYSGSRLLHRPI